MNLNMLYLWEPLFNILMHLLRNRMGFLQKEPIEANISLTLSICPFISGNRKIQIASRNPIEAVHIQREVFPCLNSCLIIVIPFHRPSHNNAGTLPPNPVP